jgi:putative ABC transport system permease protein
MDSFLQDLRHGIRTLVRQPGFTAVAVLALALGIGTATTNFLAFNALFLRPLPHLTDQERLVILNQHPVAAPEQTMGVALPDYREFRARARTLEGILIHLSRTVIYAEPDEPVRWHGLSISADGLALLGVAPLLGRHFHLEEEATDAQPVAILAHHVWQTYFNADPAVLDRTVRLNGALTRIVGVMPPGFRYPENTDLYLPLRETPVDYPRGSFSFAALARLRPGVDLATAQAELDAIAAQLATEHPETNTGYGVRIVPLRENLTQELRLRMTLGLGATLLVVLIACANVANLLFARAAARSREIAIRLALGAGRARLLRQLLTEGLALGLLGGAAAVLVALWGIDLVLALIPTDLPFWLRFEFDGRVIAFVAVLTCAASMLFSLAPALHAVRSNVAEELKEGGRQAGCGPRTHRLRQALVVGEVALALVLLVGAGLMVRSYLKLQAVPPGIDPADVLAFRVGLPPTQFGDPAEREHFFAALIPHLRQLPGVQQVGAVSVLPGSPSLNVSAVNVDGKPPETHLAAADRIVHRVITPGYLDAVRLPLRRGRDFTAQDTKESIPVALIDETAAAQFFPGEDPVGRRIALVRPAAKDEAESALIVGVVGNVRQSLAAVESLPGIYFAHAQVPSAFMSVVVRAAGNPSALEPALRSAVREIHPEIPIYHVEQLDQVFARSLWLNRFFGVLFAAFAAIALFLAALGIYAVMAYTVALRTPEIGVRMALGAQPSEVVALVVRGGLRLVAIGLALGLLSAFVLARAMSAALHGISPADPPTFAIVPLVLAAVAALACWLPSRAATRIDPISALRAE